MNFNLFEVIGIAILSFGAGVIWIIRETVKFEQLEKKLIAGKNNDY